MIGTSNLDIILTCRGCGAATAMKKLRYDQQKRLICGNCQDRGKTLPDPIKQIRQDLKKPKAQDLITPPKNKLTKIPYTCKKCNYKFNFNPERGYNIKCPFCGRTDYLQKDSEFSTEKIIREVSERWGFEER